MTFQNNDLQATQLIQHAGFVRTLVGQLVRDADLAADVEQEIWLRCLEAAPKHERGIRKWMRVAALNLVRQTTRTTIRRERRERTAARGESTRSAADEVVSRDDLRRLDDAVLALPEKLYVVVSLRFYRGWPPREIAAHLDITVAAVKKRLERALERIRTELDGAYGGDRAAWCLALAPVMRGVPAGFGSGAFTLKVEAVMAACILAVIGILVHDLVTHGPMAGAGGSSPQPTHVTGRHGPPAQTPPTDAAALAAGASSSDSGVREKTIKTVPFADADGAPRTRRPAAGNGARRTILRIVGPDGSPAGACEVVLTDPSENGKGTALRLTTDGDGRVEIPSGRGHIVAAHKRGVGMSAIETLEARGTELTVALKSVAYVEGVATDAPEGSRLVFHSLEGTERIEPEDADLAPDGHFSLACTVSASVSPVAILLVQDKKILSGAVVNLSPGARRNVTIHAKSEGRIEGVVLNADGAPVPDARIRVAPEGPGLLLDGGALKDALPRTLRSDARGHFSADVPSKGTYVIEAWNDAGVVASLKRTRIEEDVAFAAVTLRLDPGETLEGTVRDASGRPVAGARVAFSRSASSDADIAGAPLSAVNALFGRLRMRRTVTTDARGRFAAGPLARGIPYDLRVTAPGFRASERRGLAADTVVEMTLARPLAVDVRVNLADSDATSSCDVTVARVIGERLYSDPAVRVKRTGPTSFTLHGFQEGQRYRPIVVHGAGAFVGGVRTAGSDTGPWNLRVPRNGSLDVRVRTGAGDPVPHARLAVTRLDVPRRTVPPLTGTSDEGGLHRVAALAPGRYRVSVVASRAPPPREVVIEPVKPTLLVFEIGER